MEKKNRGIVYTLTARCRDCYRCLRICPVNAIGVRDGQAYIDDDKCIKCGTCIRECPQKAKTYRRDLEKVRKMVRENAVTAVSIAPSFAAAYPGWKASKIPSVLRKLGFSFVSETSDGAEITAKATVEKAGYQNCGGICTACPAVVNYTEKYRPDMIDRLIKIVSPMIAHARMIKVHRGSDCKVVFIGPCVAKKSEADRESLNGSVDAVLTFEELDEWMKLEGIDPSSLPESGFDCYGKSEDARLFPLPGGMLKTGGVDNDGISMNVMHASGAKSVMDMFSLPKDDWKFSIIEPLFCREGCINGPGMGSLDNLYKRRNEIISYSQKGNDLNEMIDAPRISLYAEFKPDTAIKGPEYSDEDIKLIYEKTGKASEEYQLNCGACGFTSCRDMAIAVLEGNAEVDMCMPYMRRLAEARRDIIIETSPNGIVILDEKLRIKSMNPAFRNYFLCSDSVIGRQISYLMDDEGFEKVASGISEKYESVIRFNGKEYHQLLYKLVDDTQYAGIFSDISNIKITDEMLDGIRKQTAEKAEELLKHQLEMAERIAMFLGESTAKSEELLDKLIGGNDE